jgi:hypothetical protein
VQVGERHTALQAAEARVEAEGKATAAAAAHVEQQTAALDAAREALTSVEAALQVGVS